MKSKKKWLIAFFLMLILLSCGKKENKGSNVENKSNTEQSEDQLVTFKDKSIERVISDFEIISKENKIKLDKFENLKYENQNFYMADIKGLVLKVGVVNNSDLAMIEDMVVNLIEVSDKRIVEDEARAIYAGLLSDIKEDKLSNSAKYKNGITYSVKIEKTGALIFSAQ